MTWLLLSASQTDVVKVAEPAISVLTQTIIGSLLLLSWVIAGIAIWQLIKVQNARITDKTEDSKRIEKLNEKLITVFAEFRNSLDNLAAAEKEGQEVLKSVKGSLDTIIFAAVQGKAVSFRPRSRSGEGGE